MTAVKRMVTVAMMAGLLGRPGAVTEPASGPASSWVFTRGTSSWIGLDTGGRCVKDPGARTNDGGTRRGDRIPGGGSALRRGWRSPVNRDFEVSRTLTGVGGWLDDRFHGARGMRGLMRKVFPDHWSFLLGEIALWSFVILLLTGTFLSLFFVPSMTEVTYHGSYMKLNGITMSQACQSTLRISFDIRGGLLIRQIHHWAADLFMAAIIVHMLRIFFTGAYRKPREINWLIGIVLFSLGLLEGLFGYSLPDDQLSGAGLRIFEGILQGIPVVGTYLAFFLFGGPFPGHDIVPRMYILHVLLIPGILLALISAHLFIMFHQKHTQMPAKGNTERNVVGQPLYPYLSPRAAPGSSSSSGCWCCWPPSPRSTRSGCTGPIRRWPSRLPPSPTSTWGCSRAPCGSCRPGRSTSSGTRSRSAR
jgi:Cytochrome b(N-terminal)/b6/petB